MECWAETLGDCSAKLSREHIVSRSLFIGDTVRVEGLSWCRTGPKEVGLASLTAKILCERHNSELSAVDAAGAKAFDTLRQVDVVTEKRRRLGLWKWRVREYRIDGPLLERWLLKALINLCYKGEHPIGAPAVARGLPHPALVKIVFGQSQFAGRAGLYFAVHAGQQVSTDETVGFAPLIKDSAYIAGGCFWFRGYRLLLYLEPAGPPERLTGIVVNGEDLGNSQLNYHNRRIDFLQGRHVSQVVHVDW